MSLSSISHGAGPGSATTLSAETIKIRDKVIERFIDKSLDELTTFLTSALNVEKDEDRRLGLLAARIYILRNRVQHIKEYNRDPSVEPMGAPTPRSLLNQQNAPAGTEQAEQDSPDAAMNANMKEVKTIEAGEINGVRIPAGITIMVNDEDAERMIANGKAIYIVKDEDGNIIQPSEDQTHQNTEDAPEETTEVADTSSAEEVEGASEATEASDDQPVPSDQPATEPSEEYISGDTGAGIAPSAEAEDAAGDTQDAEGIIAEAETEEQASEDMPDDNQADDSQKREDQRCVC